MSKPILRRYKGAKFHSMEKSELIKFLESDFGSIVSNIDDAFRSIKFEDNFLGKVIEVDVTALSETRVDNPLGKIPSGYLQLDGDFPVIKGNTWTKDALTFTSTSFLYTVNGVTLTVNTGSDQFEPATFSGFKNGQAVIFEGNVPPNPLVSGTTYWVRDVSRVGFKLSAEKNGAVINLTTGGGIPEGFSFRPTGTAKILLLG